MFFIKKINIKYLFIIIICITVFIGYVFYNKKDYIHYKEVFDIELKNNDNQYSKAIKSVKKQLDNKNLNTHEKGTYLVTLATFLYIDKDYNNFEKNFKYIESYLVENKMYEELVHLYSMITSIYLGQYEYEKAYVYIYQAEIITNNLYNNNKNKETLSTLLAIRYLKCDIALDLGLDVEADKAFEDAEKLRKKSDTRKRADSYMNIASYYYRKCEFEKALEYALETIQLTSNKEQYKSNFYESKLIIANSYIELDYPKKDIYNIVKEIEEINYDNKIFIVNKYLLYSKLFNINNMKQQSIAYLQKGYDILKDGNDFTKKKEILESLISIYEETNNKNELIKWYKEYKKVIKENEQNSEINFLIGKIIQTDTINANSRINILELERNNLMYKQTILLIFLIIIILIAIKLTYISRYDDLTKIYNRKYFDEIYKKYNYNKINYSIIMFDIDNFKKINDTYGHMFGDIVLKNISKSIKSIIGTNCKLFRYGGEEFTILIKGNDISYVLKLAEDIRQNVESMKWIEKTKVTLSIGIAYSGDKDEDIINTADINLYKSKNSGKNKVTYN